MECPLSGQPCDKPRPFHITEIEHGQVRSFDLCEDCVASYLQKPQKENVVYNLLKSLANLIQKIATKKTKKKTEMPLKQIEDVGPPSKPKIVRCPCCGASFQDLAMNIKAGCAKCYETFEIPMTQVVDTVQKSIQHTGKVPKTHPPSYKSSIQPGQFLSAKNIELKEAIAVEDYESAAKLRDEIGAFNQLLRDFRQATKDKDREKSTLIYREILAFIEASR